MDNSIFPSDVDIDAVINGAEDMTSGAVELAIRVIMFVTNYFLGVGAIVVVLSLILAVFARKNKPMRRKALICAVVFPALLFITYCILFCVLDLVLYGVPFERASDSLVEKVLGPGVGVYATSYRNMYASTKAMLAEWQVIGHVLPYNVGYIVAALFMNVAVPLACASFVFGAILFVVTVRDRGTKRWAGWCLCIFLPVLLVVGKYVVSVTILNA